MDFEKWQGCGNDFILLNENAEGVQDYALLARKLCDRHYGLGGDGILVISPSNVAEYRMRVFNTDGSEAEMCGNGIRCVAKYLWERRMVKRTDFSIETGAGILYPKIVFENSVPLGVCVDMGEPHLEAREIPVVGYGTSFVIAQDIEVDGRTFQITCVSMGNPHAVIFSENLAAVDVARYGALLEQHIAFPKKTNVEFVEVLSEKKLRMRVWERGASVTLACGTGACATLVAAVLNKKTNKAADVILDGGTLHIEWGTNNHIYMTGPANHVFSGVV